MSLNLEDYNKLEKFFGGNQEIISWISSKDYFSLSNELLKSLDGTLDGVNDLEQKSSKWIDFINNSGISKEVKDIITKSICFAFSRILINTAKK